MADRNCFGLVTVTITKPYLLTYLLLPRKMEPIEGSETSAFKPQAPGKYPKENILHKEHGESLKSRHNSITLKPLPYSRRNCDERAAAILHQHYGRPYFLPPSSSERLKLEWIYLGSSGYRESMHVCIFCTAQPIVPQTCRGL